MKPFFYYNCLICRALIGSYISSIRVQTDKNLILASFQVQLSAIKLSSLRRLIPHLFAQHLTVIGKKKLTSLFYASVPLLITDFVITLLKFTVEPPPLWQCYEAIYHQ